MLLIKYSYLSLNRFIVLNFCKSRKMKCVFIQFNKIEGLQYENTEELRHKLFRSS